LSGVVSSTTSLFIGEKILSGRSEAPSSPFNFILNYSLVINTKSQFLSLLLLNHSPNYELEVVAAGSLGGVVHL
jgi:hypothetical protein